jgi:hypothetical protein
VIVTRNGAVVSRDRAEFFRELEDEYGPHIAGQVRFVSLPIDERIRMLETQIAANQERLDELVTMYPELKSCKRGR